MITISPVNKTTISGAYMLVMEQEYFTLHKGMYRIIMLTQLSVRSFVHLSVVLPGSAGHSR